MLPNYLRRLYDQRFYEPCFTPDTFASQDCMAMVESSIYTARCFRRPFLATRLGRCLAEVRNIFYNYALIEDEGLLYHQLLGPGSPVILISISRPAVI